MNQFINFCLNHVRTVLLLFSFLFISGLYTYLTIPKESAPDVKIPIVYISVHHQGISPEDSERLILKPIEQHIRSVEGLKEIKAIASEDFGTFILEFYAGHNIDKALVDVRDKIDTAKADLPMDADDPIVKEINVSLFPVLIIQLAGDIPERTLFNIGRDLKDEIETIKSVLEAKVLGNREEVVEIVIDPMRLESFNLALSDVMRLFANNNIMVPSGSITSGSGSFMLKAPGLLETVQEIAELPLKTSGTDAVLRLRDVANVKRTYKDRLSYARDKGKSAIAVEVSKRMGENIIDTIEEVREKTIKFLEPYKDKVSVTFAQDDSQRIRDMLKELQNNIIMAVILVMIIIISALGWRSGLLVGTAIPTSFLAGIFILGLMGHTLNIVVLFSLILSVGMLVDGAIIVVEYADRKMIEGKSRLDAYKEASIRMALPVITSTVTVLVVFMPLLFWPGVVGQFMKFMPITLIATLTSSLFVALVFIPALGSLFGNVAQADKESIRSIIAAETGKLADIKGIAGNYVSILKGFIARPGKALIGSGAILYGVIFLYSTFGRGIEFFPNIEPDSAIYLVKARGNLSVEEKDRLVQEVEKQILSTREFKTIYTKSGNLQNREFSEDTIGAITVELIHWQERDKANVVLERTLKNINNIPGVIVELKINRKGPQKGKPVDIEISSEDYDLLAPEVDRIENHLETVEGIEDIEDSRPKPGIEWELKINRAEAGKYGTDVTTIGAITQLVADGMKFGTYRPEDSRDEIDVVVRFPEKYRNLNQLDQVRVQNKNGQIPITNFVKRVAKQRVASIERVDGKPFMNVQANVNSKFLVDDKIKEIQRWLDKNPGNKKVKVMFKGEEEDKKETGEFLIKAFLVAVFLIVIILVTQFNSFFSTMLVISSIGLSTIGVLVGLLVMNQAFSIVMGGIGVIALAGIIVSNNIIFIDTYDVISQETTNKTEAILRTAAQRLRPILLTQITTILGLMPILFRMDIDFLSRYITIGAPSSEWWVQLASAITFGVFFASLFTLVVTPCALQLRENYRQWRSQ
jgi:multidrug efflux pump